MYGTGNKKMLNMLILEILRKYSDEDHSLTQQEIIRLMDKNYGMECDRRSVKSNVLFLKEMGYDISMEKGYRLLSREFDDAELRILIDSVLFSKSISTRQAKGLIGKIRELASNYFNAKVSHVSNLPELNRTVNKQAMYSLDAINDAIAEKKKLSFIYNYVGTDLKLHPKREEPYIVNPYQIVANNGRFYLIGNYDKYNDIAHFRIDKMTDVKIIDEKIKPMKQVKGLENGLNLPKHMAEHIYMFSGESVNIKLKTADYMMDDLVDWFGNDIRVTKQKDDQIVVRLNCNENAMRYWALQYGPYVEVLEPKSLRAQIKEDITGMCRKYKKGEKKSKNNDENVKPAMIVEITKVKPNPNQPGKVFDEDELQELIDSIKEYGMLAPILVDNKGDYYEILAGERRWKAAKIAGLKEIPVTIREYNEKEI